MILIFMFILPEGAQSFDLLIQCFHICGVERHRVERLLILIFYVMFIKSSSFHIRFQSHKKKERSDVKQEGSMRREADVTTLPFTDNYFLCSQRSH